jgi:hypothetical protein
MNFGQIRNEIWLNFEKPVNNSNNTLSLEAENKSVKPILKKTRQNPEMKQQLPFIPLLSPFHLWALRDPKRGKA